MLHNFESRMFAATMVALTRTGHVLSRFSLQMIVRLQKEIADLKAELAVATGELRTEALTEAELHQ